MSRTNKPKLFTLEQVLEYHEGSGVPAGAGQKRAGKIEIVPTKSLLTQRDLSIAYSPGVAEPCRKIAANPEDAYLYTAKGNLVAVISNGTAVLGLGNIGALAGKPVFEGKSVLFKKYADIDAIDLEVDTENIDRFIDVVSALEPTFGGINLEDIRAPDCFAIERRLKEKLSIPVFHDDQHGTAIISGAALLNALEVSGKKIGELKVVFCGGGAASISCARFWLMLGVKKENLIMTDRLGVVFEGRTDDMNPEKSFFALKGKAWHDREPRSLADAMKGADCFMGCSVGNIVTQEMLKSMAAKPIVFAMANPDPEISYDEAVQARQDMIFATGRSDYPNQVNNVLCYPFIFRGALDVRAKTINEEMKIAAAHALAKLAKEDVPESVRQAYGGERLKFGPRYIIPKPNDPRVLLWVAPAVAQAAIQSGVALKEFPGGTFEAYQGLLEKILSKTRSAIRDLKDRLYIESSSASATKEQRKYRIVYPEGTQEKILRGAEIVRLEGIAEPVLMGEAKTIKAKIEKYNLQGLEGCEIVTPRESELFADFSSEFWDMRKRKGLTPSLAEQMMKDPLYFGAMYLKKSHADAWIAGISRSYPETIRPALQVIGSKEAQKIAGLYMALWKNRVVFLADTTVNIEPTTEDLVDIAYNTALQVKTLGYDPRVAMLSFSNFGSNHHPEAVKMRKASELFHKKYPHIPVEGEIQADTALSPELMQSHYPFSSLKESGANVLIFPNLSAANICYKLLKTLGGAELIGPILLGMQKPVHVLQINCDVMDVVNMSVIAALDAQKLNQQRT